MSVSGGEGAQPVQPVFALKFDSGLVDNRCGVCGGRATSGPRRKAVARQAGVA